MKLITVPWPAVVIEEGDTLSHVARTLAGDATLWPEMLALNPGLETHPDLIHPGDTYLVPRVWAADELRER